jgi:hypothetical protein
MLPLIFIVEVVVDGPVIAADYQISDEIQNADFRIT